MFSPNRSDNLWCKYLREAAIGFHNLQSMYLKVIMVMVNHDKLIIHIVYKKTKRNRLIYFPF